MKFKTLKLFTNKLEAELQFYSETLGFKLLKQEDNSFTIKIGWSELTFEKSEEAYIYHYCFLIPSNYLHEALKWMEKRTTIISIEHNRKIQRFESWNADSFYFYDASGNIAEFIVRYDLQNEDLKNTEFDISKVLGVNEIGMPTNNVRKINKQLESELKTKFWKGDIERFGTNGDQEGLLLLPNYECKEIWFPTTLKIKPQPFEAIAIHDNQQFKIEYKNEILKTSTFKTL
ncbi:VOC family protein [Aquimarina litoralis]|uniref:VOC family protein n=1 Tax=Aquimarina litoralis TaxID=584605 RepID=UPI001C5783E4|nr:VOC family protein [Aquimarina litoralis]MBW1296278.1 glyoxalase [Aquimarina litoralis]